MKKCVKEGFKKKLEISNWGGGGEGESETNDIFFNFFFKIGDFFKLMVSRPENANNGMKKIYPRGHVKKKRYFLTLGGRGVCLRKFGIFHLFFF